MPVTTEKTELDNDQVRLDVVVSADELQKAREKTMRRLGREIRAPGFRPGKVPPEVVMQRIGPDAANDELLKDALGTWFATAIDDADVHPIGDPDINLNRVPAEGELIFSATVQLKPTPKLGEYRGLEVPREDAEIPDGAVDDEIARLREAAASLVVVDRSAEPGDHITIDFEGRRGGKRMREAAARDYVVELGAEKLIQGFDEHLIGLSAGESVDFSITYSKGDQRANLRGSTIDYSVSMKRVHEKKVGDDDSFVREISEFSSLAELRAKIETDFQARVDDAVEEVFRRQVIEAVVENATVEVPPAMVQTRIQEMLRDGQSRLPQGVTLEEYVASQGQTMEQLVQGMAPEAEMAIKRELVVEAVAEEEGIEVSDDEVEQQIREDAEAGGTDFEELSAELDRVNGRERLKDDLALKKAVDLLVGAAVPIAPETAEAREKIWTPEEPSKDPGELWTPGSGPANPTGDA